MAAPLTSAVGGDGPPSVVTCAAHPTGALPVARDTAAYRRAVRALTLDNSPLRTKGRKRGSQLSATSLG
jgi:hypothetical protein